VTRTLTPAAEGVGRRRVLGTLCVTQLVGWGVVHYSFPVLSGTIAADTGWAAPTLAAAFSAALVVSAVLGVAVGRWIDRHGPHGVMSAGSAVAVLAMVGVAWSPSAVWFAAAWLLAGAAMSAVLYLPAFAAITRWYGQRSVGALTVLTLAGGLASTIFAPITAVLAERLGWRGAYLVLAAVLAVVTVPGHLLGLRRPWPPAPPTRLEHWPGRVARSRPFLALTITLALAAAASYAVVLNLVPLLTDRGMTTTTAAVVLGVGGAGQVLGRLAFPVLSRLLKVRGRTVLVVGGVALTTALLAALTSLPAVVVAATLAGAVRGMLTLLNATAVTDRWGAGHYGRLTGLLSAPVAVTAALSPWVGAVVAAALHGYDSMVWVMSAVAAAAALIGLASVPGRGDGDAAYTYLRGRSRPARRWKAGPSR
jgi:MFS family permease